MENQNDTINRVMNMTMKETKSMTKDPSGVAKASRSVQTSMGHWRKDVAMWVFATRQSVVGPAL